VCLNGCRWTGFFGIRWAKLPVLRKSIWGSNMVRVKFNGRMPNYKKLAHRPQLWV
jgi:hypothetical protein